MKAVGNSLAPNFRSRIPKMSESRGVEVKTSSRSQLYADHCLSSVVRTIYMIQCTLPDAVSTSLPVAETTQRFSPRKS